MMNSNKFTKYLTVRLQSLPIIEQHKAIVLTLFVLIGLFGSPFFIIISFQKFGTSLLMLVPTLGFISSFVMIYILFKFKKINFVSHLYIILLYLTTSIAAILTGNLNSDQLMLFAVYQILAVFLIGSINGLFISLIAWLGVYINHYYLTSSIAPLETSALLPKIVMMLICYVTATIITMIYEYQTKILLNTVNLQNQELLKKTKMVAYAEMAKVAAHEINNPLSIAKGNINQLQKKFTQMKLEHDDSETIQLKLSKSDQAIERIASVIRELNTHEDIDKD